MEFFILWIICGIGASVVASNRGAGGCLWLFLGVLLGPLGFALAFTTGTECPRCKKTISTKATVCPYCKAVLDGREGEGASRAPIPPMPETKPCPFCAETIQAMAIKCKHCGEFLVPKCAKCGGYLHPDQSRRFCNQCGEPVPGAAVAEPLDTDTRSA